LTYSTQLFIKSSLTLHYDQPSLYNNNMLICHIERKTNVTESSLKTTEGNKSVREYHFEHRRTHQIKYDFLQNKGLLWVLWLENLVFLCAGIKPECVLRWVTSSYTKCIFNYPFACQLNQKLFL